MIKSAVNLLCREAFKALDTAVLNTCPGWQNQNPKCRQVPGATEPYPQCTIASRETFQPPKTLFDCAYTTFQQVILSIRSQRAWLSSRRTSMVRQASGSGHPAASGSGHPGASSSGYPGASSSGHPGASSSGHPGFSSSGYPGTSGSGHPGACGSGFVTTGSGRGSPPRAELISLPSTPQFNPANKDPSLIDDPEYRVEDFSATPAPRGTIEFLPPHRSPPRYSGAGDTGSPPAIRTSPLRPELVSLPTTPQFNPANKDPSLIDDPNYRVEDFSEIPHRERACIPPPRSQPQSPPQSPPRSQPQSDLRYPPGFPPRSQPQSDPLYPPGFPPQSQPRPQPRSQPRSPPRSQPRSPPRSQPRSPPRSPPPHFAARGKGPASASGSGCASPPRPEQIFLPPTPPFNPAHTDPSLIEDPDFGVDDISCVDPDSRGKAPYVSPRRSPQSPRARAGSPVSHPVFSGGAFTGFEFSLPPTPEEPSGPVDSALLMDEDFSVADFEPAENQPDALAGK
nr:PREDICTED: basic salivary proline-rich protein 1-like [Bemisia tabaci]